MKHKIMLSYACCLLCLASSAAVPLRWTVETSRAQPATFEAYQGETLALEASLQSYGKPLELSGIAALYWQTNGMGSTYWEASAAVNSNRLSAVFTPEMDVGAKVYNCFIGVPGTIYHAAFQLRLRPSPGATPNVLPLPVPVIDFAKVRVLNPPWEGGGGGGVNTNAVIDIIHDTVSGSARSLPKYLHERYFDDSYPEAAEEYYAQRQGGGAVPAPQCSSVRSGGFLYRNFDYPFDDRAEFVVKMSAGPNRFASVGVAHVGTNLTEQMVTSGKPEYSHLYKWLPGATVDGINENGVACNINVVDGDPQTSGWYGTTIPDPIHPLAAIRWILDHATNAQQAATYIASHIRFPAGWTQNFHYMIADETSTYIVENGSAFPWEQYLPAVNPVLTNYQFLGGEPGTGEGRERANILAGGANITNAWYTNAYRRETNPPWVSDLAEVLAYTNEIFNAWASHPKEYFRNSSLIPHPSSLTWWQTVHTSIYDITNRVLRVAVQEQDDWYTFAVPSAGGGIKEETDPTATAKANAAIAAAGCVRTNENGFLDGELKTGNDGTGFTLSGTGLQSTDMRTTVSQGYVYVNNDGHAEIRKDGYDVVYGISVNGGEAMHGDVELDIPDVSGFVPYTGAEHPVDLGNNDLSTSGNLQGEIVYADFAFGCNYTQYKDGLISCPDGNEYFLPGNVKYGKYPMFDFALRSQIEDATNGLVSAENPTFSNAVDTIVRSIMPTKLRAYDPVRQCWWNIQPVNGVLTLTVED